MTDAQKLVLLRNTVSMCADTFRSYEQLHMKKLDTELTDAERSDVHRKVRVNRERAVSCERVLQETM